MKIFLALVSGVDEIAMFSLESGESGDFALSLLSLLLQLRLRIQTGWEVRCFWSSTADGDSFQKLALGFLV